MCSYDCAVLAFSSMQSGMGADALVLIKDLNYLAGNADIHLMLDIFIRDAVMHLLHRYVIVELYDGHFPEGQFVRGDRQRL